MSHELRTPLNAIILLSKMMADNRDAKLSEADIRKAEVIHRSGNDLLRLINDVLDLSKVDAGHMDLQIADIKTGDLAGNLEDLFVSVAQSKQLIFDLQDRIQGVIFSDPGKLGQILRNLLSNAFKFTKAGTITLLIERQHGQLYPIIISVKDTGIGIPEEKIGTIFEAFRQADGSITREYGGTGLGLTISLRLAQLLGGTIQVESQVGKGSTFSVCLPDHPSASLTVVSTKPIAKGKKGDPTVLDDRGDLRAGDNIILIIDDDVEFCNAVVEINHRLSYKTVVAHTADQGLTLARFHKPKGILLDLGLPDRDGTDLLRELKSSAELAAIPVYIVSARERAGMSGQQSIAGYIQKPADPDQIAAAEMILLSAVNPHRNAGILIFSGDTESDRDIQVTIQTMINHKFSAQRCDVRHVINKSSLLSALMQKEWTLIIIAVTGSSIAEALEVAKTARQKHPNISILFYGIKHLTDDEEALLRAYTDSIISSAPTAGQRLLENTERLLRRFLQEELTPVNDLVISPARKRLNGIHVLVVDDDVRNLFVLTAVLEQEGAHVINASNGRRALELLEYEQIDVIITDIMMPEMDGYQTIKAVRDNQKLTHLPIIALSAKAMPEDRKNILETGADDYLAKPVDYDILTNMVAVWNEKKKMLPKFA